MGGVSKPTDWIILNDLEPDHPLRNVPLRSLDAQSKPHLARAWRRVADWKIGGCTFNQLGPAWTRFGQFRSPAP